MLNIGCTYRERVNLPASVLLDHAHVLKLSEAQKKAIAENWALRLALLATLNTAGLEVHRVCCINREHGHTHLKSDSVFHIFHKSQAMEQLLPFQQICLHRSLPVHSRLHWLIPELSALQGLPTEGKKGEDIIRICFKSFTLSQCLFFSEVCQALHVYQPDSPRNRQRNIEISLKSIAYQQKWESKLKLDIQEHIPPH